MEVVYLCKSCKKYSKVKTRAKNRYDLRDELGSVEPTLQCSECLSSSKMHVNRLIAQSHTSTSLLIILGLFAVIALCTVLLLSVGFISTATFVIPLIVYGIYKKQQEETIRLFNKAMVR